MVIRSPHFFSILEGTIMGRKKTTIETGETQRQLMDAALEVVGTKGIEGATARAIANVAGVNQSLIFYHFGSVTQLLIEAINSLNESRFKVYEAALSQAKTVEDLLAVTFEIFEEDRHGTSYVVLSQMVAGAKNIPEIATALEPLFEKFLELIKRSLTQVLGDVELPANITYDDVAIGIISLFLGVRLIGSVPKYDGQVDSLIEKVKSAAPFLNLMLTMLSIQNSSTVKDN